MALATYGCHRVNIWSWKDKYSVAALQQAWLTLAFYHYDDKLWDLSCLPVAWAGTHL